MSSFHESVHGSEPKVAPSGAQRYMQVKCCAPNLDDPNPNVQVTGLRVAVVAVHAKLRRAGYAKRASRVRRIAESDWISLA